MHKPNICFQPKQKGVKRMAARRWFTAVLEFQDQLPSALQRLWRLQDYLSRELSM